MESTRQRLTEPPPPSRGVVNDLRRLGRDGSASAAELREFFARMRGKSPQEALGLVSQSGLVRGMVLSTAAFALVLVVFTVVPYALSGDKDAPTDKPATAAAKPQPEAKPAADTGAQPAAPADAAAAAASNAADATGTPSASEPNLDRAARVLGIDETKGTDPSDVPDLDNILDKKFE